MEEQLEIVLAALRNESSKAELCRQRGIAPMSLDEWIKRFLEGGKAGLSGDRNGSSPNGEQFRKLYNTERIHQSLGYLTPLEMILKWKEKITYSNVA